MHIGKNAASNDQNSLIEARQDHRQSLANAGARPQIRFDPLDAARMNDFVVELFQLGFVLRFFIGQKNEQVAYRTFRRCF